VNFVHIAGHLGADPEVRYTSTGKKVTTLRVACRTRKGGQDDTIWWRVSIWGEQYDKMVSFLKKGSPVLVFGEVQKPEIFNDREGKPQISMEITASHIHFSPFGKPDREGGSQGQPGAPAPQPFHNAGDSVNSYVKSAAGAPPHGQTIDDEVPF
jgi:single-strand DNA-binding protein